MDATECFVPLLWWIGMIALFTLGSAWKEHRIKTMRRGCDAASFAQSCAHPALSDEQLLALYRYLQGIFLIKDVPICPDDSIDDLWGLDDDDLYDLVEDLLGALKTRRSQQEIAQIVDRQNPQTVQDLLTVVALLISPIASRDQHGPINQSTS